LTATAPHRAGLGNMAGFFIDRQLGCQPSAKPLQLAGKWLASRSGENRHILKYCVFSLRCLKTPLAPGTPFDPR
jgi:hypothetical protein